MRSLTRSQHMANVSTWLKNSEGNKPKVCFQISQARAQAPWFEIPWTSRTSGSNTLVLGEHPENEQKSEKNKICQDVYHCLTRNFRTFRFDSWPYPDSDQWMDHLGSPTTLRTRRAAMSELTFTVSIGQDLMESSYPVGMNPSEPIRTMISQYRA